MKENISLGMNGCFPADQDGVTRLHSACVVPAHIAEAIPGAPVLKDEEGIPACLLV